MEIIPDGLWTEERGGVRIWQKLKPPYLNKPVRTDPYTASADESDLLRIKEEANTEELAKLEYLKKGLHGKEAEKEIVACGLLNLVEVASHDRNITDLAIVKMEIAYDLKSNGPKPGDPKSCSLSAHAYFLENKVLAEKTR